jgi:hypothetical protein
MFRSAHGLLVGHGVVAIFGFSRRDVADRLEEPAVIEPVDPFERRELDGLKGTPWPASMDHLGPASNPASAASTRSSVDM